MKYKSTRQRLLNGFALDDAVLLQNREFHQNCTILINFDLKMFRSF